MPLHPAPHGAARAPGHTQGYTRAGVLPGGCVRVLSTPTPQSRGEHRALAPGHSRASPDTGQSHQHGGHPHHSEPWWCGSACTGAVWETEMAEPAGPVGEDPPASPASPNSDVPMGGWARVGGHCWVWLARVGGHLSGLVSQPGRCLKHGQMLKDPSGHTLMPAHTQPA